MEIFHKLVGKHWESMIDVSKGFLPYYPLRISHLSLNSCDLSLARCGKWLNYDIMDVMISEWHIDDRSKICHNELDIDIDGLHSRLERKVGVNEDLYGSQDHNIMLAGVSSPDILRKFKHHWQEEVKRVGVIMQNEMDAMDWTKSDQYLRWSSVSTSLYGFGQWESQLYFKRGFTFATPHDEIGWSCAGNYLAVDENLTHDGASLWIGVNRADLMNAGFKNEDIFRFYNSIDVSKMVSSWAEKNVPVYYCVQRVGDLVVSPPGTGAMHMVLSVGDLMQVALNHGFTVGGYNSCIQAWKGFEKPNWTSNSGLATRNVITPKMMKKLFPNQRFVK